MVSVVPKVLAAPMGLTVPAGRAVEPTVAVVAVIRWDRCGGWCRSMAG